jgi:hypothetical protein
MSKIAYSCSLADFFVDESGTKTRLTTGYVV